MHTRRPLTSGCSRQRVLVCCTSRPHSILTSLQQCLTGAFQLSLSFSLSLSLSLSLARSLDVFCSWELVNSHVRTWMVERFALPPFFFTRSPALSLMLPLTHAQWSFAIHGLLRDEASAHHRRARYVDSSLFFSVITFICLIIYLSLSRSVYNSDFHALCVCVRVCVFVCVSQVLPSHTWNNGGSTL